MGLAARCDTCDGVRLASTIAFRRQSPAKLDDLWMFRCQLSGSLHCQQSQASRRDGIPSGSLVFVMTTARPLGVGDITQLEPNIHAGAKYSRQLRDQYFSDDGINELNKGLFTVAAYNAGPTRIEKLRRLTGFAPRASLEEIVDSVIAHFDRSRRQPTVERASLEA